MAIACVLRSARDFQMSRMSARPLSSPRCQTDDRHCPDAPNHRRNAIYKRVDRWHFGAQPLKSSIGPPLLLTMRLVSANVDSGHLLTTGAMGTSTNCACLGNASSDDKNNKKTGDQHMRSPKNSHQRRKLHTEVGRAFGQTLGDLTPAMSARKTPAQWDDYHDARRWCCVRFKICEPPQSCQRRQES